MAVSQSLVRIAAAVCVLAATTPQTRAQSVAGGNTASLGLKSTLIGFPGKPPAPFYHQQWKEEIAEPAHRAAVADTVGDGKPRLILLIEKPQQRGLAILKIKKWDGTAFVTEFSGDVESGPDKLVVGKFAGNDKAAVIVTADAVWSWNGTTYIRKAARKDLSLFGAARMKTGEERLIISDTYTQFKSYSVNPSAPEEWLTDRTEAPSATQVEWESMRASADFFRQMGMPSFLGSGGVITIWDTTKANVPYIYYCRPAKDVETRLPDGSLKIDSYIGFRDATEAGGNEIWSTPKLNGLATDIALSDPKDPGKRGLLILTNAATAGKATLYFFGLD